MLSTTPNTQRHGQQQTQRAAAARHRHRRRPDYTPLEDDFGPLRTEHAANLAQARLLEAAVMGDDSGSATEQKAGAKTRLKALVPRLAAALQAYAASKSNKDEDLAGRVRYSTSEIKTANDATFATTVASLLKEAAPLTNELAKREFTSRDLAETTRQLARFEQKQTSQRTTVVVGATDRKTLIALLRRNANLIKEMRVQLKPYQSSPTKHEVWERFQGYTRLIILGGGGPKGEAPAKA